MNPVEMLLDDHQRVKKLFRAFEGGDTSVGMQILNEIDVHSKLEEEVFYPALRNKADEKIQATVAEGYEEHAQVDQLVAQLKAMDPTSAEFKTKMTVLIENVEHHIEEEETEMLPDAQRTLGAQADQVAQDMQARKQQLQSTMMRS